MITPSDYTLMISNVPDFGNEDELKFDILGLEERSEKVINILILA